MQKSLVLFLTLTFLSLVLRANQNFTFNERCLSAYSEIFKLKFDKGKALIELEKKENPKNLIPYFLENYIDFLSIYISEDPTLFEQAEVRKKDRLAKIKAGDKNSPYYLFIQADIHLQWASSRLKFEQYIPALFEVRKAHKLLLENMEKYPNFKPNKKSLGLLTALFGAIPSKYKFGAKLFGLKGDINEGLKMMEETVNDPTFPFKEESAIMYTMLMLHLQKNHDKAWSMVNTGKLSLKDNLLNHFVVASVAYYSGKNENLIETLKNRPKGNEYYPFPFLDYLLGVAKLNRLDDDADVPLMLFLKTQTGKTYIKDAHRKLAWFYLLQNKPELYQKHMQLCIKEGSSLIDEDKSAFKDATRNLAPHKELLKSRLLFDGAYYKKALEVLDNINIKEIENSNYYELEYFYRKARVYDKLNDFEKAESMYLKSIELGKDIPMYYAANSCIKLANIYEKQKKITLAEEYYRKSITFGSHEYENSILAESKAGLNRIGR